MKNYYEKIQTEFCFDKEKIKHYSQQSVTVDDINLPFIVNALANIVNPVWNMEGHVSIAFNDFRVSKEEISKVCYRYKFEIFGQLILEQTYFLTGMCETSVSNVPSPSHEFTLPYIKYFQDYIINAADDYQNEKIITFEKQFYDMVENFS